MLRRSRRVQTFENIKRVLGLGCKINGEAMDGCQVIPR